MKKIFLLILLIFASANITQAQIKRRALFLGNSYTGYNNLPAIISNIALNMRDTLVIDSYTPGGYRLDDHEADPISRNKIMGGSWDYVVMQEQSQVPALPPYEINTGLCALMKQYHPCARAMFYMTWGRKNGDAAYCPYWPPMCTYAGMDSMLHLRYIEMATYNKAEISPVGAVWKYIREHYPSIELYQPDESHPSAAGSYLAACCFYTAIFRKDPTLITYNYVLFANQAAAIREATKIILYNHAADWDFVSAQPVANFSYTANTGNKEVAFTNNSSDADSYIWYFGDGDTSSLVNPVHQYLHDGLYTIQLTANNCDVRSIYQSVYKKNIYFCPCSLSVFPNPAGSFVNVIIDSSLLHAGYKMIDVLGRTVQKGKLDNLTNVINMNKISSGIYFLKSDNNNFKAVKLVKE